MARNRFNTTINDLHRRGQWEKARKLLSKEVAKEPDNHWLLTQLGVTFYEQRHYEEALRLFLKSQSIVPDCPLTLWNLAGALDALGKHAQAVRIYRWLLESDTSPAQDPCWESDAWAEALKADCLYRLGVIHERRGRKRQAERCYRQYLDLLLLGVNGTYSADDVARRIRDFHVANAGNGAADGVWRAIASTVRPARAGTEKRRRRTPPRFNVGTLLSARK